MSHNNITIKQRGVIMLRTQFEEDLNKLHNQFYSMGTQVSAQLNKAVRAFVSHDRDLAEQVIEGDHAINDQEKSLENQSLEMIALQQPVSSDLRTIITVLKASSDLERMGDHVASIAKATISLKGEERIHVVEEDISLLGEKLNLSLMLRSMLIFKEMTNVLMKLLNNNMSSKA